MELLAQFTQRFLLLHMRGCTACFEPLNAGVDVRELQRNPVQQFTSHLHHGVNCITEDVWRRTASAAGLKTSCHTTAKNCICGVIALLPVILQEPCWLFLVAACPPVPAAALK